MTARLAALALIALAAAGCAGPQPPRGERGPGAAAPPAQSPAARHAAPQKGDDALHRYVGSIAAKIRRNIVLPPDAKGNPQAVFEVAQTPAGEVQSVRLLRSSGIPSLDRAIEAAIRKSSPLPRPENPELFSTRLNLTFRPLDG